MIKSTVTAALISIAVAAKLAGCSQSTLRRWEAEEKLDGIVYRYSSGHRRYDKQKLLEFVGESGEGSESTFLVYARISSAGQDRVQVGGLDGQVEECQKYIREKYNRESTVIFKDIASGLNFSRPAMSKLLEEAMNGKWDGSTLIVLHSDRLSRFGADFITRILNKFNVKVEIVHQIDKGSDAEVVDDLLNVLAHFNAKKQGRRSAAKRKQFISPETRERIIQLHGQGMYGNAIYNQLKAEEVKCLNGTWVTLRIIYSVLRSIGVKPGRGRKKKKDLGRFTGAAEIKTLVKPS